MDAINTARRQRLVATVAVVFAFACSVPSARAAAWLLIPPPVDLITELPHHTPDGTHNVVSGGPDLHFPTYPAGTNSRVLHTQSTPEPASLVLGVFGSGLVAVGAWYRRRRARRRAKEAEGENAAG